MTHYDQPLPQLLQELLGRVGGIALRRAGREGDLPAELDDGGEESSDDADDDRGADSAPRRVGPLQQSGQHGCLQVEGTNTETGPVDGLQIERCLSRPLSTGPASRKPGTGGGRHL